MRTSFFSCGLILAAILVQSSRSQGQQPDQSGSDKNSLEARLDELIQLAENPEPFVSIKPQSVQAAREALATAVKELESRLADLEPEQRQAWGRYMELGKLKEQLDSEKPDRETLRSIYRKLQRNHAGLEYRVFTNLRSALDDFVHKSYFSSEARAKRIYDSRVRLVKAALEKLKSERDDRTVALLGEAIMDLEHSGNCPKLVAAIRKVIAKPNFHFELSERLAKSVLKNQRKIDTRPVEEDILGVMQRGTAHTVATFDVDFLPSSHSGRIKVCINGDVVSDQVGTKSLGILGNVYICSRGNTCLVGEAVVDFDGRQLGYSDLASGARTRTQIQGVDTPPLLRNATLRQIDKQKSQGEAEAAERARVRFVRQLKQQLKESIGKANARMKNGIQATTRRLNFEPNRLEVTSGENNFRVLALVGNRRQLGSLRGPSSNIKGDLVTQLHESAINNALQHVLGDQTIEVSELRGLIESFGVELPPPPEDEKPLTISFPRVRPVQVSFDDQKIKVVISSNSIVSGRTEVKDDMKITVEYEIQSRPDAVVVSRVGEILIDFEGVYTNSKSVIESVVKPKLEKLFKKEKREFKLADIEFPKELENIELPFIREVKLDSGWFVTVLNVADDSVAFQDASHPTLSKRIVPVRPAGNPVTSRRQSINDQEHQGHQVPVRPLNPASPSVVSISDTSFRVSDR